MVLVGPLFCYVFLPFYNYNFYNSKRGAGAQTFGCQYHLFIIAHMLLPGGRAAGACGQDLIQKTMVARLW